MDTHVIINLTNKGKVVLLIMAEIIWNANGQGEFDFDYLLNLTDDFFVERVKKDIDNPFFKSMKISVGERFVKVIIVNDGLVYLRSYDMVNFMDNHIVLHGVDIDWIGSV